MRAQHIPAGGGGGSGHGGRDLLIGVFVILGAIIITPSVTKAATSEQSVMGSPAPDNQLLDWTVARQKGFNSDWNCWMLQLHRTDPSGETDGDFCAVDKADYDSHPSGSHYQTHGDWLDNVLQGPRDNP